MPATFELNVPTASEIDAWSPNVEINGGLRSDFAVINWESTVGPTPAKALIKYIGAPGSDGTSGSCAVLDAPITLDSALPLSDTAKNDKIRLGARIRLFRGDETLYLGTIVKRMDAGAKDEVLLECVDDLHMLSLLTVDGAFVRDSATGYAKWIRRLPALPNPSGMWNCTGSKVFSGDDTIYPVFSEYASREVAYEDPDATYDYKVEEGKIYPWTPRRFLLYLCMLTNTKFDSGVPGVNIGFWRSLVNSNRLKWNSDSITSMIGVERIEETDDDLVIDNSDPLDRKLPQVSMQGISMLNAIHRVLDIAGTHTSILSPTVVDKKHISNLEFAAIGLTGNFSVNSLLTSPLPLQRDGTANNINTAYDFRTSESIQAARDAIKVAGDVVRLETSLEYTGYSTGSLQKAWTQEQEDAFIYCITGGSSQRSKEFTWAKIPDTYGSTDTSKFVSADGIEGRPLVLPMTSEAVGLARLHFPQVFAAFRVDSSILSSSLRGVDDVYAYAFAYPVLLGRRPVFKEQLQFLLRESSLGGDDINNWLTTKYPPNTEVYSNETWWQVPPGGEGLSVSGDGVLWLPGLVESSQGREWCLLNHPISNHGGEIPDPKSIHAITLKKFRINISLPFDHRVEGYAERYAGDQQMDGDYSIDTGGLPLLCIDSPEAYKEGHQINSRATIKYTSETNGDGEEGEEIVTITTENKYAPPGSERPSAQKAAERKLLITGTEKTSSWSMIGLRTEYSAGQYIYFANQISESGTEEYLVRSTIGKIVFDVGSQSTSVEGTPSSLGSAL